MTALIARAALLLCLLSTTRADFTGASFDSVSEGSSLNLTWDNTGLDADAFPLIVFVSLINQTAGHDVFGLKTNLSISVNTDSYTWQGLPYPAPYLTTALYQVEVRPSHYKKAGDQTVIARSPFFSIKQKTEDDSGPSSGDPGNERPPADPPQEHGGGLNRNVAIAIGVVVGVFSLMAIGVVGWCFRRRQSKAKEEMRRRKRMDFVIS